MAIGGLVTDNNARPACASELEAMAQRMRVLEKWNAQHRVGPNIGFVATAPPGQSDIVVTDDVAVVCDTDIHNEAELSAELSLARTTGTGDLIAALFRRFGIDFLQRLRGSFAIGIWDGVERRLILAVDRIGVKPLAYSAGSQLAIFASQPSAIFAGGRIDAR